MGSLVLEMEEAMLDDGTDVMKEMMTNKDDLLPIVVIRIHTIKNPELRNLGDPPESGSLGEVHAELGIGSASNFPILARIARKVAFSHLRR